MNFPVVKKLSLLKLRK